MATANGEKSADAGFFEKNFRKLKDKLHFEYMLSRITLVGVWLCLATLFVWDFAYFHSKTGVEMKFLIVAALYFLLNGLRKMVLRLLQIREQSAPIIGLVEKPYNPGEPWWMHVGFRLALGQRRALIGFITLSTEVLGALFLLYCLIAVGLNEKLFMLSWDFPFVMKPFVMQTLTFPENFWVFLAIIAGARLLAWVNNSIFLMKIPQVRETLIGLLQDYLMGHRPVEIVAGEVVKHLQKRRADTGCCGESVAERLLAILPPEKQSEESTLEDREKRIKDLIREVAKVLEKNGNGNGTNGATPHA